MKTTFLVTCVNCPNEYYEKQEESNPPNPGNCNKCNSNKMLVVSAPYPFCHGNPTVKNCIKAGYCTKEFACND